MRTTVRHNGRLVRADYSGGPYIELTFGSEAFHPTEVINVWNYATGRPELDALRAESPDVVRAAVRLEVLDWIATQDQEWPEWYAGYLENASW